MEKQIILKEEDFMQLEKKARLYDKNAIAIHFRLSSSITGSFRDVDVDILDRGNKLPEGILADVEAFISRMRDLAISETEREISYLERYKNRDTPDTKKLEAIEVKYYKIPSWIRKIFK